MLLRIWWQFQWGFNGFFSQWQLLDGNNLHRMYECTTLDVFQRVPLMTQTRCVGTSTVVTKVASDFSDSSANMSVQRCQQFVMLFLSVMQYRHVVSVV